MWRSSKHPRDVFTPQQSSEPFFPDLSQDETLLGARSMNSASSSAGAFTATKYRPRSLQQQQQQTKEESKEQNNYFTTSQPTHIRTLGVSQSSASFSTTRPPVAASDLLHSLSTSSINIPPPVNWSDQYIFSGAPTTVHTSSTTGGQPNSNASKKLTNRYGKWTGVEEVLEHSKEVIEACNRGGDNAKGKKSLSARSNGVTADYDPSEFNTFLTSDIAASSRKQPHQTSSSLSQPRMLYSSASHSSLLTASSSQSAARSPFSSLPPSNPPASACVSAHVTPGMREMMKSMNAESSKGRLVKELSEKAVRGNSEEEEKTMLVKPSVLLAAGMITKSSSDSSTNQKSSKSLSHHNHHPKDTYSAPTFLQSLWTQHQGMMEQARKTAVQAIGDTNNNNNNNTPSLQSTLISSIQLTHADTLLSLLTPQLTVLDTTLREFIHHHASTSRESARVLEGLVEHQKFVRECLVKFVEVVARQGGGGGGSGREDETVEDGIDELNQEDEMGEASQVASQQQQQQQVTSSTNDDTPTPFSFGSSSHWSSHRTLSRFQSQRRREIEQERVYLSAVELVVKVNELRKEEGRVRERKFREEKEERRKEKEKERRRKLEEEDADDDTSTKKSSHLHRHKKPKQLDPLTDEISLLSQKRITLQTQLDAMKLKMDAKYTEKFVRYHQNIVDAAAAAAVQEETSTSTSSSSTNSEKDVDPALLSLHISLLSNSTPHTTHHSGTSSSSMSGKHQHRLPHSTWLTTSVPVKVGGESDSTDAAAAKTVNNSSSSSSSSATLSTHRLTSLLSLENHLSSLHESHINLLTAHQTLERQYDAMEERLMVERGLAKEAEVVHALAMKSADTRVSTAEASVTRLEEQLTRTKSLLCAKEVNLAEKEEELQSLRQQASQVQAAYTQYIAAKSITSTIETQTSMPDTGLQPGGWDALGRFAAAEKQAATPSAPGSASSTKERKAGGAGGKKHAALQHSRKLLSAVSAASSLAIGAGGHSSSRSNGDSNSTNISGASSPSLSPSPLPRSRRSSVIATMLSSNSNNNANMSSPAGHQYSNSASPAVSPMMMSVSSPSQALLSSRNASSPSTSSPTIASVASTLKSMSTRRRSQSESFVHAAAAAAAASAMSSARGEGSAMQLLSLDEPLTTLTEEV